MGFLLLAGGAEFMGQMAEADQRALRLAGGMTAPVSLIPTAAVPEKGHEQGGKNGQAWFKGLGVRSVRILPVLDRPSADRPEIADVLRRSRMIYFLGGSPAYLAATLRGTQTWQAVWDAGSGGAVIGGSSAGAMVLFETFWDPWLKRFAPGFGFLSGAVLLPHHDTYGRKWAESLAPNYPERVFIGIDEETAMLNDGPQGQWRVYGRGRVAVYRQGRLTEYCKGALEASLIHPVVNRPLASG